MGAEITQTEGGACEEKVEESIDEAAARRIRFLDRPEVAAGLASYLPPRRALRLDPAKTLRARVEKGAELCGRRSPSARTGDRIRGS